MLEECREGPEAAERLLVSDAAALAELARDLRAQAPASVLTVARGSSDHAAHYMAYLIMARLGRLVTSLPMSIVTLYHANLRCEGLLAVAFSQSGRSPDLVAPIESVRSGGARTVVFVNDDRSPLAQAAQWLFPLHAGPESSVAATKSFLAQLVAGARLVAAWQANETWSAAVRALPEAMQRALQQDWTSMVEGLRDCDRLFVIGRGTGLSIAMEAALKFKEVCGLQAEAYSGAELRHGPLALVEEGYPLLIFAPRGPAQAGLLELANDLRGRGANVLLAAPAGTPGAQMTIAGAAHEDLDPVSAIQSFYPAVEALARARGMDPDKPRHLQKVTQTH